jgi:dipeptidyl aminopeptidase/acylaminoacyl peptidase
MSRSRDSWPAYLAALFAGLMLVACADEDTGPQFATDPRPTQPATEAALPAATPPPALLPTTVPIATPASFTDLLAVRGAVSTVFIPTDSDVWSISSAGTATRLFAAPDGASIRAIAPAPNAQEVAVLLETATDEQSRFQVVIVDVAASVVARSDLPAAALAPATPVARDRDSRETIDWSPQGDRILAQIQARDVVEIDPGELGPPIPLDFSDATGNVIAPEWSPTGQSIAFIAESEDGETRSLNVLDTTNGQISPVVTPIVGRLVVDFTWLPDGVTLLFTEGGGPDNATTGIDLWRIDANGENRALVASAGTVAPVARITNLSPSPDGRSVAYTVLVPGSRGPVVDSVWVRSLASGVGFRIPLPSVASVQEIWWTDNGIVISVVTSGTAQGRAPTEALLQVKRDGSIAALWAAPFAVGTPTGATPAAGSGATQPSAAGTG